MTVVDDPFVFSVFVFSLVQAVSNNNAKTSERDFFICNHSFQSIHKFSNVNNCCKKTIPYYKNIIKKKSQKAKAINRGAKKGQKL
ncbi:hypothetical protein [Enterococcus faecalis]|uniref:hypothetical protein n=1 Tax=Enterococcus faecalis TaxID=1351 RepID=UPI001F5BD4F0|nr:hypothetical protein [Enterococcus faecalis]UNQ07220.1 hypothetical protein MKI49_002020 [Enterococcus faecalis]